MLERFYGESGLRLVIEALQDQSLIGDSISLAKTISDIAEVVGFPAGLTIIEESAPDNEVCFILSGNVSIRVGGREVAVRKAGQHIGEMSILDAGQPRSASAVALDEVVVARVGAANFVRVADSNSRLWRNIARELSERLRQRNRFVSPMNTVPALFVGCSAESLPLGRAIQTAFSHDLVSVRVWTDNVFQASTFPVESLEVELANADFAVMVLSPDDSVTSRETTTDAPRDNVIFELGFFMGVLGRSRTFLVCPRGLELKIPTDLLAITTLAYDVGDENEPAIAVASACNEIRNLIHRDGPR